MKKIYLIISALFFLMPYFGLGQIVADGLNNSSSLFTISGTGGGYSSGNSAAGDRPTSSPFASEGSHSYGVSNGTATLTSSNINTTGYTGIQMQFRLASFSINSNGNGADGGDNITVEVSPNGGTNWYSTLLVLGNTNACWAYSTGTGIASTAYDGDVTPINFTPAAGGLRTTDGYSNVIVTGLPASSNLSIRVTLLNNDVNERWVIDDFKVTGTVAVPTITSANTGLWSAGTTWVGGVAPTAADNVVIAHTHIVTFDGAANRNSGTTTTVSAAATLIATAAYTNNGTTTINGIFQLNNGGSASGNDFVYGGASTLNLNLSAGQTVNSTDVYWPSIGPYNVSVLQGGVTLNTGANRIVNGMFQTAAGVSLSGASLTLNGIAQINSDGFFSNTPIYGSASTLVYNSLNRNYLLGNEWTGNAITAGAGVPQNVTIQNGTNLLMLSTSRGLAGNLTITSSNITLDAVSGDLNVGGNWTNNGGSFTPNGRAVFFNGSGTQTITNAAGEIFNYLVNNKPAGTLTLADNITVNASSGNALQLINAGGFNLNGKILTLPNAGGNIQVTGAARTISSTIAGAIININGFKSVISATGGSLILSNNITTVLYAGLDFGSSLTTIQGALQINTNGFVSNNAPIYSNTSSLIYNGVTGYGVNNEWTGNAATAGLGTPQNVTLTSSSVNMPTTTRRLAGNLIIGAGSTLNLNASFGADLNIGGNWTNSGTFTHNSRLVTFNGTAAQSITGATTFDFLTLNNSTGLTLANAVIVNQTLALTSGRITLGANNLTIGSSGTITGASASNFVITNGTGILTRNSVGNTATSFPVGNLSTSFTPLTITNTGTVNDISVGSSATIINPVTDPTRIVALQWSVSSGGASAVANIVFNWNSPSNEGGSYNATGTGELGNYTTGPNYTITGIGAMAGTSKTVSGIALTSGTNRLVIGNTGMVYTAPPANDLCVNAVNLTVNGAATAGTTLGATVTTPFTANTDVWYRFTAPCSVTYTVTIATTAQDVDLYAWSVSCPAATGGSIGTGGVSSSLTTESLTLNSTAGVTYFIRAVYYSATGGSNAGPFTIAITGTGTAPAQPGFITGSTSVCANTGSLGYSITAVGTATSYTWTLPASWTGSSSTPSITATSGASGGNITVTANNACGSSAVQTLAVSVTNLPTPGGSISGTTPACGSTSLSYSAPAANIYWQTSATGTSTATATTSALVVSASGSYYVRQTDGTCWSTASTVYAVTIYTQTVITTQPTSQIVTSPAPATFTVVATNAIGYQWEIFDGVTWVNVPAAAPYSGTTSGTLTISPTSVALTDNEYRCIVKGNAPCVNVTSNVVSLTVNPGPCVSESFTSATFPPTGWLATSITRSTAAADYNTDPAAAIFGSTNGSLTTSLIANPSTLKFFLGRSNNTTAKTLTVEISTTSQTSGFTTIATYDHSNVPSDSYNQYAINLTAYTGNNNVWVRFVKASSTTSPWRLDDITFTCGSGCVPTQDIISFTPADGPVGTLVTINGTGFVAGATVKFGGIASTSVSFVNASTLIAEVPAGGISGPITVTQSGCDRVSTNSFSILRSNNNCGVAGVPVSNGLIISEVFDSEVGTLGYVEIFNPTTGGISLSGYSIRVATGVNRDYPLGSATLASGATVVVSLGDPTNSNATVCSVTTPTTYNNAEGFNGNDQIILRLGLADHDVVNNPNYGSANNDAFRGFSQLRNPGNTTPRATYVAAEWTNSNTESCSNLGVAPTAVNSNNITINTQPADVNCNNTLTFSVAATGTPGISTYVWRYQAPGSTTWSLVSAFPGALGVTVVGTSTASITITGNTANLRDYQFYVQVETGGSPNCFRYSNAAQYSYESKAVYRSKNVSGNWNDPNTWEMADLVAGTYIPVCNYPTAANSDEVIIRNGQSVTLNIDNSIDKITIDAGGALSTEPNSTLDIVGNASGPDFIINGTFRDSANTSNTLGIASGTTWLMGANATIIKTNSGGAGAYRDNYEGGIINIPVNANWIYRYVNASITSIGIASANSGSAMYYPNLTLENLVDGNTYSSNFTGGAPLFSPFTFTSSANPITIKGNFDVGGAGSGFINFLSINNNAPVAVNGNMIVRTGNTVRNNGDATNNGTGFDVKGNLTVDGTLTLTGGTALTGNLVLSGSASSNQVISGAGTINLEDVNINNTGTGAVVVNKNLDIPGTLDFGNAAAKLTLGTGNITLKSTSSRTANVGQILPGVAINYSPGKFIVERNLRTDIKWRFLSAPTSDPLQTVRNSWQEGGALPAGYGVWALDTRWTAATPLGFDGKGTNSSVKKFNSALAVWEAVANTDVLPISTEKGYMVFVAGDRNYQSAGAATATTLRTSGALYRNNQNTTVAAGKFGTVANPYPSRIDMRTIAKPGFNEAIYVWDPSLTSYYGFGAWNTFSLQGGNYVNLLNSPIYGLPLTPNNFIESGMAFIVKNDAASVGTVTISESSKSNGSSAVVHSFTETNPQSFRVNLFNLPAGTTSPILLDGVMANFDSSYTNGIDVYDIKKMNAFGESVSWKTADSSLVIDRRYAVADKDTLHLNMLRLRAQNYQWEIISDNMDFPGRTGFLIDRYLNTSTPLNLAGTTTVNFSVANIAGSYAADRFKIVFNQPDLGPLPVTITTVTASRKADRSIDVNWKVENESNISSYELERSADGNNFGNIHTRAALTNIGASATYVHNDRLVLPTDNFYRIKATSVGGQVQYSTIVKVAALKEKAAISIYPNPVEGREVQVRFTGQPFGRYQLQIVNAAGQVIYQSIVAVSSTVQAQQLSLPAKTAAGAYQLRVIAADGSSTVQQLLLQ